MMCNTPYSFVIAHLTTPSESIEALGQSAWSCMACGTETGGNVFLDAVFPLSHPVGPTKSLTWDTW